MSSWKEWHTYAVNPHVSSKLSLDEVRYEDPESEVRSNIPFTKVAYDPKQKQYLRED